MKTTANSILLVLLFLLFNPVFGQRMNGKVKSCKLTYYAVHESYGKIKKGSRLNDSVFHDQFVSFHQNGNISKLVEYDNKGKVSCEFKGKTDYTDNHFESVFIKYDPEKMIDRKPFIIESIKYPSGERYEMTYKNDSKGRPEEETIFDLMGSVISKIIIRRDVNGNALEYNFSDGNVDQFKYDDQGYRIESISHTASGNKVITTYKYDLSGNLIEENINDFFKTAYKYHFEHNTYTYQYDKQENWIERTEYEHDIPLRVVIRTIEYAK